MLDDRKAAILSAVVEEYIETAQPVGSQHVAKAGAVQASSATIRNEMAVLEREGYLVQPHTSAGRIPTDKGYRFFVDRLPEWGSGDAGSGVLDEEQATVVRQFFDRAHGELESMLSDTSHLLSRLTTHTAVVVAPSVESASIRSIQVVGLSGRAALVVVVLSTGQVDKHGFELPAQPDAAGDQVSEVTVNAASTHLTRHLVGRTLGSLGELPASGDAGIDAVVAAVLTALRAEHQVEPDAVYVGGASRMAQAFDAVGTVRQVLGLLEQQMVVVTLVRDLLDRGLSVAIGAEEHGLGPLAECSVIVAPIGGEHGHQGSIGLLGPTRMNYSQALAAVAVVSQRLGSALQ